MKEREAYGKPGVGLPSVGPLLTVIYQASGLLSGFHQER